MYADVDIAFSPQSLLVLNGILACMMFGVSLQLTPGDFKRVLSQPRAPVAGLVALAVFAAFVIIAVARNLHLLVEYGDQVMALVVLHNLGALSLGALAGWLLRLPVSERRAVTMEVGIQNSALGLSILFTFFPGAGGMMLITAFWGVWHLISGLTLALIWSRGRGPAHG